MKFVALAVAAITAAVFISCGGDGADAEPSPTRPPGPAPSSLTVNLSNWAVEADSPVVRAGTVSFTAVHEQDHAHGSNEGGATHQLLVARLKDGATSGQSKFGSPVLNLDGIKPGETKTGEAVLEPGTYELACLVVEKAGGKDVNHYAKGMHAVLKVE